MLKINFFTNFQKKSEKKNFDIDKTSKNAGEIELVFRKERANRVRLVLLMDAGGSMTPHNALVSRLFSAATESKIFKSFEHYYFHNCVYQWLYRDFENYDRVPTGEVLRDLTHEHRLIFVGDASMATWELMSPGYAMARDQRRGIDWLHAFSKKCPGNINGQGPEDQLLPIDATY